MCLIALGLSVVYSIALWQFIDSFRIITARNAKIRSVAISTTIAF